MFLDCATFLALLVLAMQYSWNHFVRSLYKGRLKKKNLPEDIAETKANKMTRIVQVAVMLLLGLAVILALVDLVWK